MDCPCRWATIYLLIYLSLQVGNVSCQNNQLVRMQQEVSEQPQTGNPNREVTQTPSPSKSELLNALLSFATAKGLLPKSTQIVSTPQIATSQNEPKIFNTVSFEPQITSNNIKPIISSTPAVSVNPILNRVSQPATNSYSQAIVLQPTLETESVPWTYSPKTSQMGCVENYGGPQPSQAVWQIPQSPQPFVLSSCSPYQPVLFNEATPPQANLQTSPPIYTITPTTNPRYTVDNVYEPNCGPLSEEPLLTDDCSTAIPINLQIILSLPNDLYPKSTVVSDAPTSPEPVADFSPYSCPPAQPIIIRRSQSSWQKLLPLILLALTDNCGCCRGCGCSCNCDSDKTIPMPFPIPIPVNNPIINGCDSPYSSRSRD